MMPELAVSERPKVNVTTRKLIPIERLKNARHNPRNRIEEDNLKDLLESMELIGLLCPVIISPDNEIIDGHRRVACAKLLKWNNIECNVVEGDAALIYASVNASSRKMSGSDNLSIWLRNPSAVPSKSLAKFKAMEKMIGRDLCKKIASEGYSIRVYDTAKRICKYCGSDTKDDYRLAINWLIDVATMGQVQKALERGESPKLIMQAIIANKPLVFKMHIGE